MWPDVSKAWINVDRWPETAARKKAFAIFEDLDRLNAVLIGAEKDDSDPEAIPFVNFAPQVQVLFDEWRSQLEARVRGGTEHPAMESHLAKYRSLVPSLALLIHQSLESGNVNG